jgi:hypothetical protein
VNSPGKDRSACGSVIEDIKRLLSSFQSSSTHVYRSQNVAAHVLAHSVDYSSVIVCQFGVVCLPSVFGML